MNILNFSHPLTDKQVEQIEALTAQKIAQIIHHPAQFDLERDFESQIAELITGLHISSLEWQSSAWLIVPPSLNFGTAVLLAELHGRMGHFPAILRLRPTRANFITEYEVAEIIDLETARQTARTRR